MIDNSKKTNSVEIRYSGPLNGSCVKNYGAKNSAMPILTVGALNADNTRIDNVPLISDTKILLEIFRLHGAEYQQFGNSVVFDKINSNNLIDIPDALSSKFRGVVYAMLFPLITKGRVEVGKIGGDNIKGRSLEPHIRALKAFGYDVFYSDYKLLIEQKETLRPVEFVIDDTGISATSLSIIIASGIEGESKIHNASTELEVDDLISYINVLGARCYRDHNTILVHGPLEKKNSIYSVPLDRMVIGTLIVASILTGGYYEIRKEDCFRMTPILDVLKSIGISFIENGQYIRIQGHLKNGVEIITGIFPSFPCDMVPQFITLLTQLNGLSKITETIHGSRFDHVNDLKKMGAHIEFKDNSVVINGPTNLTGGEYYGTGIRETVALILAGLVSSNKTVVHNLHHMYRGYECLLEDLIELGADIRLFSN